MRRFLKRYGYMALFIVLVSGAFAIAEVRDSTPKLPKPSEIVCTCGCGQKDIQCGDHCSVARELLKKYKGA